MPNVADITYERHDLATYIYDKYHSWDQLRDGWKEEKAEIRKYLHATDTRKTTNVKLPWKNSTVTPKLTQIRDNLHANYLAALFPREKWFTFEPADRESATLEKRSAIENYMITKMKQHDFQVLMSQIVLDYIDYGNCFVGHEFVNETKTDPVTGEIVPVYRGPRPYRISPMDIVFDPTATSFKESPCIVRRLKSIGELVKDVETRPHLEWDAAVVNQLRESRYKGTGWVDAYKEAGFAVDGFDSIQNYFDSGMVEIHDFYGDLYDPFTNTYMTNRVITVADGRFVLRNIENRSWLGHRPIFHCGWRLRADNLWAAGPLDQLIGMQYRIDHLENLKADVFDQIAHPVILIKGTTVEEFEFRPEEKIYLGADGEVTFARPEAAALGANMEINEIMARMEELAGAPKQAMGIRTPGEKTAYEVQSLENAAGRIFQSKVSWFERNIIEPLINSMLEEGVRGMDAAEQIKTIDPELGHENFVDITKADILHRGKLNPMGARHFAEKARFVQEFNQTIQMVAGVPSIARHFSGWAGAQAVEDAMGWQGYNMVRKNVAIMEEKEAQQLTQAAQEDLQAEAQQPHDLQPEDVIQEQPEPTEEEVAQEQLS